MEKEKFIEELNKKTKKEIVDLLEQLVDDEKINLDIFENCITAQEMSLEEKDIIEKLKTKNSLTEIELNHIKERLNKRANAKISTILSGANKFDAFLVEIKLEDCFNVAWKYYPRKVGKELGKKSYIKLFKDIKLSEINKNANYILQKIIKYVEYCNDKELDEQYISHFSTFCNSKKYL